MLPSNLSASQVICGVVFVVSFIAAWWLTLKADLNRREGVSWWRLAITPRILASNLFNERGQRYRRIHRWTSIVALASFVLFFIQLF